MVIRNSSTEDGSSGSMEDRERRFYSRSAPSRQAPPSTSSSESESESDSDNGSPRVSSPPQKKPQPPPRNVASSPNPSSTKRPRDEEQSRGMEKNKKPKEVKKTPPLETPKQNEKKTTEEKKKVKKSASSPKSSTKKNGQLWNPRDEIGFLKGVAAYQESKGLPKTNMSPVYDYIRKLKLLEHEYTNIQMYDKLRRSKGKFTSLKEKVDAGDYKFKTPHEEAVYKLCRKIWRSGEEEEAESTEEEDEKNGDEGAQDEKKSKGKDVEMAQKENEGKDVEMTQKENEEEEEEHEDEDEAIAREGNLVSNGVQKQTKQSNTKENRKPSDVVLKNGNSESADKLLDVLREENLAMVNAMQVQNAREKQELKSEIMEMVKEARRNSASTGTSASVQFSSEEMIKRISSSRELPALEKEDAERLQRKWHTQNLVELDVSYKRLQLLQEECQLRIERLGAQAEKQNP